VECGSVGAQVPRRSMLRESQVKSGENKVPGFRAVQLACFYCQKKPTRFALKENVAGDWLPDNGVS